MRKLVLILILLPNISHADICFTTLEQDSADAKVIFTGELVDISKSAFWNPNTRLGYDKVFTFRVKESYKGLKANVTLLSVLGPGRGCCNPKFELDSIHIVFAYEYGENSGIYWTNDCSLSGRLYEKNAIKEALGIPIIHSENNYEITQFLNIGSRPDSLIFALRKEIIEKKHLTQNAKMLQWISITLGVLLAGLTIMLIRKNGK